MSAPLKSSSPRCALAPSSAKPAPLMASVTPLCRLIAERSKVSPIALPNVIVYVPGAVVPSMIWISPSSCASVVTWVPDETGHQTLLRLGCPLRVRGGNPSEYSHGGGGDLNQTARRCVMGIATLYPIRRGRCCWRRMGWSAAKPIGPPGRTNARASGSRVRRRPCRSGAAPADPRHSALPLRRMGRPQQDPFGSPRGLRTRGDQALECVGDRAEAAAPADQRLHDDFAGGAPQDPAA